MKNWVFFFAAVLVIALPNLTILCLFEPPSQEPSHVMGFKSNDQVESSPFTVFGRLTYIERDDTMAYGRNYYCKVMDHDVVSDDDTLWEGETD